MRSYLLLALAIGLVCAKPAWWEVIPISDFPQIESVGIYRDGGKTPAAYVYAKDSNSASFCFIKLNSTNQPISEYKCETKYTVGGHSFVLAGKEDGKTLFLAYSLPRIPDRTECKAASPEGCDEVLFIQSEDDGKTWTEPLKMTRPNMNDVIKRRYPSILYVKELDKVFVFYATLADLGITCGLRQTSKKADTTSSFSNERMVTSEGIYHFDGIRTFYTMSEPNPVLHVFSRQTGRTSYTYFRSATGGATWTKFALATKGTGMICDPIVEPSLYKDLIVATCTVNYYDIKLYWSGDQGATWKYYEFPRMENGITLIATAFAPPAATNEKTVMIAYYYGYQKYFTTLFNIDKLIKTEIADSPLQSTAAVASWYRAEDKTNHVRVASLYSNSLLFYAFHPDGSTMISS